MKICLGGGKSGGSWQSTKQKSELRQPVSGRGAPRGPPRRLHHQRPPLPLLRPLPLPRHRHRHRQPLPRHRKWIIERSGRNCVKQKSELRQPVNALGAPQGPPRRLHHQRPPLPLQRQPLPLQRQPVNARAPPGPQQRPHLHLAVAVAVAVHVPVPPPRLPPAAH